MKEIDTHLNNSFISFTYELNVSQCKKENKRGG